MAALAVAIAWPASTPPVLGPDGRPVPGSIAELATVRLGGVDQTVMIRAANPDAPVLLYLAGGPGQSDLALTRVAAEPWVDDVVFVDWDQRGTGKSYAALEPSRSLTLEQAVADTIELTEILRDRFDERRIYLMGESWGSILGVLAVQRRPDLYYAWIGSGQMVDVVETDRRVYRDLVDYAARTGDGALAAKLAEIGEPPYRDIPWANANLLAWYEYLYAPYTPSPGYLARGEAGGLDPFGILGSEYNLVEKTTVLRGLIDTFALLYPQLYGIDFRRDVARLEVPVYMLDGAAELEGRRDLALEWFEGLTAPSKTRITFDGAAHRSHSSRPTRWLACGRADHPADRRTLRRLRRHVRTTMGPEMPAKRHVAPSSRPTERAPTDIGSRADDGRLAAAEVAAERMAAATRRVAGRAADAAGASLRRPTASSRRSSRRPSTWPLPPATSPSRARGTFPIGASSERAAAEPVRGPPRGTRRPAAGARADVGPGRRDRRHRGDGGGPTRPGLPAPAGVPLQELGCPLAADPPRHGGDAVLPPIDVLRTRDGYWVTDGHNRVAAAKVVGQVEVDADVKGVVLPGEPIMRPPGSLAPVLEESSHIEAAARGRLSRGTTLGRTVQERDLGPRPGDPDDTGPAAPENGDGAEPAT